MEDEIDLRSLPFFYPFTSWHSLLELSVPPSHSTRGPLVTALWISVYSQGSNYFGQKDLASSVNSDSRNKIKKIE